ncbi:N-acetylglucosamine kinase [Acetatifactor aquisgranensis]|uniref:N-acetylglucosamine kinase n=1 Tax=Acetatifactor aquisgranensis TaxID=2941233 RepID=UPI00203AB2A2|nr:BadF/BadG/BcrA/BcrD ATPase family protein [Acetatifactor aquisgranensis]MCI8543457.1 hypothetical protein [Lachnospiraceae bacterium]
MYYLGVDCGGTKSAFLLGDKNGKIYARYRSGGCIIMDARKEGLKETLEEGLRAVCGQAGIGKERIACMGLGISCYGEGEGTEEETWEACREVLSPDRVVCQCDTYVGWAGSLLFRPGINIISGTGAIAFGVNKEGKTARSSGWGAGYDEGSCTWHGRKLVEAYTRQADGRMERTRLYEMFRKYFGIKGDDVHFVTPLNRKIVQAGKFAELQRLLKEVYESGDPVARSIYEEGARELWMSVESVAKKLGLTDSDFSVSYSGGLFKSGDCILKPFGRLVEAGGGKLVLPRQEPDVGALMMAIKEKEPDFDADNYVLQDLPAASGNH